MQDPLYDKIEVGGHPLFPGPVIKLWAGSVLDVIPVGEQGIVALGEACRAYAAEHDLTAVAAPR